MKKKNCILILLLCCFVTGCHKYQHTDTPPTYQSLDDNLSPEDRAEMEKENKMAEKFRVFSVAKFEEAFQALGYKKVSKQKGVYNYALKEKGISIQVTSTSDKCGGFFISITPDYFSSETTYDAFAEAVSQVVSLANDSCEKEEIKNLYKVAGELEAEDSKDIPLGSKLFVTINGGNDKYETTFNIIRTPQQN